MAIKIAAYQAEIIPAQPDKNAAHILALLGDAQKRGAQIAVFPELCLPGYMLGDLWEQPEFLRDCEYYGELIADATKETELTVIFGNVAVDPSCVNEDGHVRKYNALFAAQHGKFLQGYAGYRFIVKNSLPVYREFDDRRHFFSLNWLCQERGLQLKDTVQPIKIELRNNCGARCSIKLGLLLCEDGWTENYLTDMPQLLAANGAELLLNSSCSPFTLGKDNKRHRVFAAQAKTHGVPLVYCNNIGIQNTGKDIFTFDGGSCVYDTDGNIAAEAAPYCEQVLELEFSSSSNALAPSSLRLTSAAAKPVSLTPDAAAECSDIFAGRYAAKDKTRCKIFNGANDARASADSAQNFAARVPEKDDAETIAIYRAISYGTKHFLANCGIKKMVVGISGGIDSAVTSALYADVLGAKNLLLVNLPSRYNSQTTKNIARQIAENLGAHYAVFPIQESVELTQAQINNTDIHSFADGSDQRLKITPFMLENIQARDRGARVLAALAAAFGGGFSCNGNKSELTVGYATFYGDIAGVVAPLGDLWKYQVYALGRYFNTHVFKREVLPDAVFKIKPSAELSDAQTVGNGGDPLLYEYHDYLLRSFIETWDKAAPADLLEHYAAGDLDSFIGCEDGLSYRLFPLVSSFCSDLEKWYKLFAGFAVAKRIQAPPLLAVSRRAYGTDYREAQNAPYISRHYYELKAQLLHKEFSAAKNSTSIKPNP